MQNKLLPHLAGLPFRNGFPQKPTVPLPEGAGGHFKAGIAGQEPKKKLWPPKGGKAVEDG